MWLATDLDREGESIAWHIAEYAGLDPDQIRRVTFSEITKGAIDEAFANPRSINLDLVNAQQARRVIDRLVGYKLSPLVSSKIRRGLSAGRVQSVAVRLVVDREREIDAFVPEVLDPAGPAAPARRGGELRGGADPHRWREGPHRLRGGKRASTKKRCAAPLQVSKVTRSQQKKNAPPPSPPAPCSRRRRAS